MKSITAAVVFAACLAAAGGLVAPVRAETQLFGVHAYAAHDVWQNELVRRFKLQRPDIEIAYRASAPSYEDGLLAIARQSLTGQEPDFHLGGMQLLRAFVARKMIEPFDDLLAGRDLAAMGYSKEILAEGQLDGHQYALPWGVSTPVVFINEDLVRKAGGDPATAAASWESLLAIAAKISKTGPEMMGMYWETGTDDWMTQNLLLNNAAPLLSPDERRVGFDNDRGLAALAMYRRFFTEGGQQPIETQAARQTFFAGKTGFYMTTTAAIRSFRTESGDRFALRTAALPLMSPDATLSSAGMVAFVLTKDPQKRRAALDFILFGTSAESQAWVVRNTGYMPSNTGALRADLLGDFYRDNPAFYTSVTQLPRARAWLGWPGENAVKISFVIRDHMIALSNGQSDPKTTLAAMAHDVNALLPQK